MRGRGGDGGGIFAIDRFLGMCRWLGFHFEIGVDYNRVAAQSY